MMHTQRTMFMFALVTGAAFAPVPGVGAGIASMQGLLSDTSVSGRATVALLFAQKKRRNFAGSSRRIVRQGLVCKGGGCSLAGVMERSQSARGYCAPAR